MHYFLLSPHPYFLPQNCMCIIIIVIIKNISCVLV